MIVGCIALTLEYAFKVAQEPFRIFPFPTDSEVEHHRASRPNVRFSDTRSR